MVGIKDIAKAAGVSISTVSYALNGSPKVTEATRARITAIANELNYIPNMAARTLKKQETKIIAVYLADYGGSFYGELLEGIKKGLAHYNYDMIVCSGQKSHLFLPERMVDGGIILDWTFSTEEIIQFANRGHSLVVLDREISCPNVRKVLLDNKGGATLAMEKIISSNPEKVYLVTGPEEAFDSCQRLEASERELARYGVKYEVIPSAFTEESGYAAAEIIHSKITGPPVTIFSFNDEMAVGIYKYFRNTDREIGIDISLIGFDNIEIGSFLNPSLATISYSKHRWGMVAAEKVVQLINKEVVEDESIITSFVEGKSFISNKK
jgi:LacI family transcriptional regulator